MALRTLQLVGFPLVTGRFRYRGRPYKLLRQHIRHVERLIRIIEEADRDLHRPVGWLLSHRRFFRLMPESGSAAVLALLVERTRNIDMKRLAIWLLGRCHGTLGIMAIATASRDDNVILRREVARALKRKQAWAQLRDMHAHDTDDRVRAISQQHSPEPHQRRLNTFLDDVARREVSSRHTELKVNVDLDLTPGQPPKDQKWIRTMLEQIRSLVRDRA